MARRGANQHTAAPTNSGCNQYGTGIEPTVARLKRDNPDLAERVIRGELSANAAAIEAGFRKPTWTAPDDPERLAERVRQRYPGWAIPDPAQTSPLRRAFLLPSPAKKSTC